jgi:hypothetical protein
MDTWQGHSGFQRVFRMVPERLVASRISLPQAAMIRGPSCIPTSLRIRPISSLLR